MVETVPSQYEICSRPQKNVINLICIFRTLSKFVIFIRARNQSFLFGRVFIIGATLNHLSIIFELP